MAVLALHKIAKDSKKQQHKNHNPYAHIAEGVLVSAISNVKVNLSNAY